ncbi:trans-aconitate 2-methyltransferase [Exophiala aquamarina CBS 119918]|uniref:Trans-aconitate 2-methyltransferase n=1 Tax=Exophiala aquamarina CBS 119918 TaxID=1182545 RepID=A0A072PD61_9EURO|nr:trans-aconitate 2-methyltransferase [Exophiala aquamarina CBS 119918]KEF57756.1 trans-aconitate 2-methyltransferase [Exophiala aquamarina CBS 119918]
MNVVSRNRFGLQFTAATKQLLPKQQHQVQWTLTTTRTFRSSIAAMVDAQQKDWSAAQYLKFNVERTRPSRDLLSHVPLSAPKQVVDLGCGPGNSTEVLVSQYPKSTVAGMDSSPDMIAKAKATLPTVEFTLADLGTYKPDRPVDLFFSNAVFQWLSADERIRVIKTLFETQAPGGVFAFQVPDNFNEPSHEAMRSVAASGPWAETLKRHQPARDVFQSPQELYDELSPLASSLNIWHTYYQHVLENHEAVVEWVKGTGLRPFIDPLAPEQRAQFLGEYLKRVKQLYPMSHDGKVLLRYPRLFLVAVRKQGVSRVI